MRSHASDKWQYALCLQLILSLWEPLQLIETCAADVNAAVLHAMGLLLAHAAHMFGSHSDQRKHPLRSGPDGIILHATFTPHAKTGVFWATMQVTTSFLLEWLPCSPLRPPAPRLPLPRPSLIPL